MAANTDLFVGNHDKGTVHLREAELSKCESIKFSDICSHQIIKSSSIIATYFPSLTGYSYVQHDIMGEPMKPAPPVDVSLESLGFHPGFYKVDGAESFLFDGSSMSGARAAFWMNSEGSDKSDELTQDILKFSPVEVDMGANDLSKLFAVNAANAIRVRLETVSNCDPNITIDFLNLALWEQPIILNDTDILASVLDGVNCHSVTLQSLGFSPGKYHVCYYNEVIFAGKLKGTGIKELAKYLGIKRGAVNYQEAHTRILLTAVLITTTTKGDIMGEPMAPPVPVEIKEKEDMDDLSKLFIAKDSNTVRVRLAPVSNYDPYTEIEFSDLTSLPMPIATTDIGAFAIVKIGDWSHRVTLQSLGFPPGDYHIDNYNEVIFANKLKDTNIKELAKYLGVMRLADNYGETHSRALLTVTPATAETAAALVSAPPPPSSSSSTTTTTTTTKGDTMNNNGPSLMDRITIKQKHALVQAAFTKAAHQIAKLIDIAIEQALPDSVKAVAQFPPTKAAVASIVGTVLIEKLGAKHPNAANLIDAYIDNEAVNALNMLNIDGLFDGLLEKIIPIAAALPMMESPIPIPTPTETKEIENK